MSTPLLSGLLDFGRSPVEIRPAKTLSSFFTTHSLDPIYYNQDFIFACLSIVSNRDDNILLSKLIAERSGNTKKKRSTGKETNVEVSQTYLEQKT